MDPSEYKKYVSMVLADLHTIWSPHQGQLPTGKALYYENKKRIFKRCGRKFGKTEELIYHLHRCAMTTFNAQYYYVAPYYNQAGELIWHNGRLPDFLQQFKSKYIEKVYETDRRIVFKTGSFIKLLGSDNYESGRGINPDGVVYDEFKDFDIRFHKGMEPNLAPKNAFLMIAGTPPESEDHFFAQVERDTASRKSGIVIVSPTHTNPHIDKEWLKEEEEAYRARGEYPEFMREYLAQYARGGGNAIFPMLKVPTKDLTDTYVGATDHYCNYEETIVRIKRRVRDFDFYLGFDPGTTSCFAALLIAVNRYDKEVIAVDCLYVTNQEETSTKQVFPKALTLFEPIHHDLDRVTMIYDYAAAWFAQEVQYEFGMAILPCEKDLKNKEAKLSLIKDMLLGNHLRMTDKCAKLMWEMSNYYRDENGKIPKKNDHLIDILRYNLNAAGYDSVPINKRVVDKEEQRFRRYKERDEDIEDFEINPSKQFEKILNDGDYL